MSLIVLLLLPFIGSCLAALLPHNTRNTESLLAGLVALVGTIQVALLYPQIAHGGVIREEFMWLPSLGLNFVLRMDGFAWLFSMLVLGIGTLVSLYARYYMSPDDPVPRFFAFFLAFMGAMRPGDLRQPDPDRILLGTDQPVFVPADRLLAPPCRCATQGVYGADGHWRRRFCACWRGDAAGAYRRQL